MRPCGRKFFCPAHVVLRTDPRKPGIADAILVQATGLGEVRDQARFVAEFIGCRGQDAGGDDVLGAGAVDNRAVDEAGLVERHVERARELVFDEVGEGDRREAGIDSQD